ncbi:CobW family GTP-binding protein [Paeniglutamicibacter sp. R2-26]|uniref:CobW family GTP-binding protein n=1 Tax=Paeniglutamicibacter sp. R2-26 TaxID=3144417 RepID=UPI003EE79C38
MNARLSIIGGYLGSGKSTMVNRLLAGALPGRTAVVVNDFGSVNIDADLVAAADGDTIELSNGCICCQLGDDVSRTMAALAEREDLEHVICEVSGVGDPGELAAWRSYPGFTPGPVVVCADATAIVRRLRDEYVADTVRRQLESAGIVVLTKTDLASPAETAGALEACWAAAPQALVIEQDPLDPAATAARVFAAGAPASPWACAAGTPAPAGNLADPRMVSHTEAHATCTVDFDGPLPVGALARVLEGHADQLVRAKGIVQDAGARWQEVQLAAGRVEVRERAPGAPEPAGARLVLIAAGALREEHLEAARAELLCTARRPHLAAAS